MYKSIIAVAALMCASSVSGESILSGSVSKRHDDVTCPVLWNYIESHHDEEGCCPGVLKERNDEGYCCVGSNDNDDDNDDDFSSCLAAIWLGDDNYNAEVSSAASSTSMASATRGATPTNAALPAITQAPLVRGIAAAAGAGAVAAGWYGF